MFVLFRMVVCGLLCAVLPLFKYLLWCVFAYTFCSLHWSLCIVRCSLACVDGLVLVVVCQ